MVHVGGVLVGLVRLDLSLGNGLVGDFDEVSRHPNSPTPMTCTQLDYVILLLKLGFSPAIGLLCY